MSFYRGQCWVLVLCVVCGVRHAQAFRLTALARQTGRPWPDCRDGASCPIPFGATQLRQAGLCRFRRTPQTTHCQAFIKRMSTLDQLNDLPFGQASEVGIREIVYSDILALIHHLSFNIQHSVRYTALQSE